MSAMTAAIRAPQPSRRPATRPVRGLQLVGADVEPIGPGAARPPLRLVPGGREAALRHRQPAAVYRRRRWAAALVAVTVLVAGLAAARALERRVVDETGAVGTAAAPVASSPPAPAGGDTAGATVHVVQPGDTAWSIARRLQPDGDVRPLVDELVERSGGGALRAGQRLDLTGLAP
jgi:nucleoid-associated protein YgaU